MKKFALILLSIALVLSCTVIAFASDYQITVENPVVGETYTAYKVFDVSYDRPSQAATDETPAVEPTAYTYTISSSSQWWTTLITPNEPDPENPIDTTAASFNVDGLIFTRMANGTTYVVTPDDTVSSENLAKTIADKLYANVSGKSPVIPGVQAATTDPLTLDVGSDGYYFVNTSLGALCALNTTSPTARVREKNSIPSVEKEVSKDGGTTYTDSTNVSIGDPVNFRIEITDGRGTDKVLNLTDTMSDGLDFVYNEGHTDITVTLNGTAVTAGANTFTLTEPTNANPRTFTIVFAQPFMASVQETDEFYVTYTAALNENAQIKGNTNGTSGAEALNINTVTITYNGHPSTDTATVETYGFDIVKVDTDSNIIGTAQFEIYDAPEAGSGNTLGDQVKVVYVSTDADGRKVYRVDPDAATSAVIEADVARIIGIGEGSYLLVETAAPDGYNAIETPQSFSIGAANNYATLAENNTKHATGGVPVENTTGSQMPATGGIGTYLFYGIGAILVVGAVVVLVSKKRMHAYSD